MVHVVDVNAFHKLSAHWKVHFWFIQDKIISGQGPDGKHQQT